MIPADQSTRNFRITLFRVLPDIGNNMDKLDEDADSSWKRFQIFAEVSCNSDSK